MDYQESYTETTNEHGFPQTLLDDHENVCCTCRGGYTNRGAGMECPPCQSASLAECMHDEA
jgi:hypothetical protein